MMKETKIRLMAPVPEPPVSFPAPFSALPCPWWDCATDPSTSHPSALKSLLMALGLLSAISSLPTCITKRG